MSDRACGIIASRQEHILGVGYREDGYLAECIMPQGHGPYPHIIRTPEGLYFAWEDDDDCDCCNDDRGDPDRCYVIWPITEVEAQASISEATQEK